MSEEYVKTFKCPQCGKGLSIDLNKKYKAGLCPSCRNRITIPDAPKPSNKRD